MERIKEVLSPFLKHPDVSASRWCSNKVEPPSDGEKLPVRSYRKLEYAAIIDFIQFLSEHLETLLFVIQTLATYTAVRRNF